MAIARADYDNLLARLEALIAEAAPASDLAKTRTKLHAILEAVPVASDEPELDPAVPAAVEPGHVDGPLGADVHPIEPPAASPAEPPAEPPAHENQ